MIYIMSCVWLDYMVKYFQTKNCEGSSPTDKKCTASFLVPVYIVVADFVSFATTFFIKVVGLIFAGASAVQHSIF